MVSQNSSFDWVGGDRRSGGLTDDLTGLGNYRAFMTAMRTALEAKSAAPVLAIVDLDDFLTLNVEHGREYGDRVLVAFAGRLRHLMTCAQAYRIASDEFALVVNGGSAEVVAAELGRFCYDMRNQLSGITASAGVVALSHRRHGTPAEACTEAKAALAEAKSRGRANAVAFEEIRERSAIVSSQTSSALRKLIASRRITMVYQPIFEVNGGAVHGFEALARPDPAFGLTTQQAFDLAEKLALAHELDALCRSIILAEAADHPAPLKLFVNLAPQSLLRETDALVEVAAGMRERGADPGSIVFEITERSSAGSHMIAQRARLLRQAGFGIALDDTGAGNAGLELLSQLEVDYLKIDRAVIMKACTDRIARSVLVGICAIAKENGSRVIAEGIEDDIMLEAVCGIEGVHAVQGYLLGQPSRNRASETAEHLLRWN